MKYIKRDDYLKKLISLRDKKVIKVISGIRRSGKSTLLKMFADYLIDNKVKEKNIIMINLESLDFEELKDYKKLNTYIENKLQKGMNYVFIDEIQNCPAFEKTVDSLYIKDNVDLYITGSNAYFMSKELATLLSGRYMEIKILPLSFKEYVKTTDKNLSLETKYANYITNSSYPYALKFDDINDIREYLNSLYNTTLLKDVIERNKISDVTTLETVIRFVADNIGNYLSTNKIANTLTSSGHKIDFKTVDKYIDYLENALFIYKAYRYNVKGKEILKNQNKYYLADVAYKNLLTKNKNLDFGYILENVVYLELIRRGYQVYIGKHEDLEIDFVATKDNETTYFQVSYSIKDSKTFDREIIPLQKITDHYKKMIITFDNIPNKNIDGIEIIYAINWLLDM